MLTYDEAVQKVFSYIREGLTEQDKIQRPIQMRRLLDRLGRPDAAYPIFHIAGTKGKGSTSAMISHMLTANGYLTGLYTSPHLQDLRERIQINGHSIPPADFARVLTEVAPHFEAIGGLGFPSAMMAVALVYYAEMGADAVVLEAHVGGLHDATNAVTPDVSVITPIGYDHIDILGATLDSIATHKAAIIKVGRPVVSAPQADAALTVIEQTAERFAAPLTVIGRDVQVTVTAHDLQQQTVIMTDETGQQQAYQTNLLGAHQAMNLATAVTAIKQGRLRVDQLAIADGLRQVRWSGRFEIASTSPLIVLDSAHTVESAQTLSDALKSYFPDRRVRLIYGSKHKKDMRGILNILAPLVDDLILTGLAEPLLDPPESLRPIAESVGYTAIQTTSTADEALQRARVNLPDGQMIVVTGSVYLVGAARTALGLSPA